MRSSTIGRARLPLRCALGLAATLVAALPYASLAAEGACSGEIAQVRSDRGDFAARADAVTVSLDQFEACARQVADAADIGERCKRTRSVYREAVAALDAATRRVEARMRRIDAACAKGADGRAIEAPAAPAVQNAPSREEAVPPREAPPPRSRDALQPPPGVNPSCDLARSYKGKIPFDGVLRICQRSLSEADCRVCLGPE